MQLALMLYCVPLLEPLALMAHALVCVIGIDGISVASVIGIDDTSVSSLVEPTSL